jgi:hypothetical protein
MSTPIEDRDLQYGNMIKPGRQGVLGLPLGVSLLGIPFIIIIVLMLTQRWFLPALLLSVVMIAAAAVMTFRGKDGRNWYERRTLLTMQRISERRGDNLYLAGPAGKTPDGKTRLPGLAADSELSEHYDSYGNPFGLIRLRAAKHYTVVFEAFPDGDALKEKRRIDSQVAHWGAWLTQLGVNGGIVGASVTVETAPDSGLRLTRMIQNNMDPSASPFAATVTRSIPEEFQVASPSISTRIAITFSGKAVEEERSDRGLSSMAEEIGNRIPVLLSTLYDTGAGTSVRACTAQDIIDFTRTAYDPTVSTQIEQARADGGTGLSWEEAGPVFHDARVDRYFHDRAVSKSWQMAEGPDGMFYSNSLREMFDPTPGVLRKRVTILYRPIPRSEQKAVVQADLNNARFAGSQGEHISARQQRQFEFAQKAAQEEAGGAGLVRFGTIVTVTVANSAEFPRLNHMIPSLANQARLKLRPALGNQAVAFQAGLPLGVVLPAHTLLPDTVKDWI